MREASFGIYYDLPLLRKEVRVSGLNYGDYFIGGGLSISSCFRRCKGDCFDFA